MTVSEITSVVIVFVICWLLNIYGCLLVSALPSVACYQYAYQCFALTLNLLLYCVPNELFAIKYKDYPVS